jgi:putative ABC transport system permease protein
VNLVRLSVAYLRARSLNSALNIVLMALGVAMIVLLILFSSQLEDRMLRDGREIDLVVGAKGSPLQLILSSVYHVDVPTGNIPLAEAKEIRRNSQVRTAIPLALGDSYRGFRIVGTDHAYPAHYEARLAHGRLWQAPLEATIGYLVAEGTGLGVGAPFIGAHGLGGDGAAHAEHAYRIVGVLQPTRTVLDRLILTSVESVWRVHAAHGAEKPERPADRHDDEEHEHEPGSEGAEREAEGSEITALLITYNSPIAAVAFPRFVNSHAALQAAAPAREITRLLSLLGVGVDAIRGFALLLVATAALGVFIALTNALQQRRYDLAVMRSLGARRRTLFAQLVLEGSILALAGTALGLILGHAAVELVGQLVPQAGAMGLTGLSWRHEELYVLLIAIVVGVVAAALPALQAYRTDVAAVLATR